MKSGGPIKRRTPLRAGKPLAPGAPLQRRTGLAGGGELHRAGPLPAKRATPRRTSREHVCCGETVGKRLVRVRSGGTETEYGPCELCGLRRAVEWSHRKAEGRGGCWCASNGLASCSACHRDGAGSIHRDPVRADEMGWTVKTGHDPAAVPVVLAAWAPRRVLLLADGGVTFDPG